MTPRKYILLDEGDKTEPGDELFNPNSGKWDMLDKHQLQEALFFDSNVDLPIRRKSDAIINSRLPTKEEACKRPTKKERDAAGENTLMGWDKIINPK